jgi:hypothetical protein
VRVIGFSASRLHFYLRYLSPNVRYQIIDVLIG